MRITIKFIIMILLFYFILFYFIGCSIPQILPILNIPIAEKNSYTIEESSQFDNLSIIFTCTNQETYFKGYYFYYLDSSGFLNQAAFSYFDTNSNKWVVLDSIPSSDELSTFITKKDFQFTFFFSKSFYPTSANSNSSIKDTYVIIQKDNENDLSKLYLKGKSLTIYLVPIGLDSYGPYIYTPAFSTTSNKVIFSFK